VATLATDVLTFDERVKRMDKNGTRTIIEIAAKSNRSLASMMVKSGNETNGNTSVSRKTYPSGTWTSMTEGVGSERSTTEEIWDASGTLEIFSHIPKRYVDGAPDKRAARMQEEAAFIIGLSEEVEDTVFSGDRATNHKEFTGLKQRYNSSTSGDNFGQVVSGGGTGATMTDIFYVGWGERQCSLFFGKNHMGGLQTHDLGVDKVDLDGNGKHIMAYSTHYEWNVGLMVEDYRSIARIANIDATDSTTLTAANIDELMIDAYYRIPSKLQGPGGKWYCNRTVAAQLHKDARNNTQMNLSLDTWEGKQIPHFLGSPIIQTDFLTNTNSNI
jgi:hypothetical protein